MQISRTLRWALAAGLLAATAASAAGESTYRSPEDALSQGIGAYQSGYYEMAVPALLYAAEHKVFTAEFYLARIYSDNSGPYTNHANAYNLFRKISEENTEVDPDDDARAPFVAKSLTKVAGYLLTGLPEIGLKADTKRAAEYLREAAGFFRDEDAQFELAKLQLQGEGGADEVRNAKHWLATLSERGHAGAQAFLADLKWRGKHVDQDKVNAFALISVAVTNAPPQDRVWIEDIYQNIYCGAGEGIRSQATGMVAEWQDRYGRKPNVKADRSGLSRLDAAAIRTCANGEEVPFMRKSETTAQDAQQPQAVPQSASPGFSFGESNGFRGLDASAPSPNLER
jgi:uncharacterized protein